MTPAIRQVNGIDLSDLVRPCPARCALVGRKAIAMDSTTLLLLIVPIVLGLVFNAVKFMRFIGFVAGGRKKSSQRGRSYDDQLSFDERLAEKLRELERDRR